jgi:hypothetical protein
MKSFTKFFFVFIGCGMISVFAQSPTPPMVVVQAANASPAPAAAKPAAPEQNANELRTAAQTLEQIKAANADTLKRQEAVMQQLDELQKAADQIRIFAHRSGG